MANDEEVKSYPYVEQYPYGYEFQSMVLALTFREARFLDQYEHIIVPKYFDNEEFRHLARIATTYFTQYGKIPDLKVAYGVVRTYCMDNKFTESVRKRLEEALDNIYRQEVSDPDWVKEQAIKFAQAQLMRDAIVEGAKLINDPANYSKIMVNIEKAMNVASPRRDGVIFNEVAFDLQKHLKEHSIFADSRRIKSGIPTFDHHCFGGQAPRKVAVVMAPSGTGKSHFLVAVGANAIRDGHNVFHYTLGDMDEWEVLSRYAANFTKIDSWSLFTGRGDGYQQAISYFLKSVESKLFVSTHPADTITPSALRSHISMQIAKTGIKPSVIIVDYADNLATGNKRTFESAEISAQLSVVYQQLIGIAHQFDCLLWTGSQVAKNSWGKAEDGVIDKEAIARSVSKVEHADYILTLNQTRDESEANTARIFEAKIRFGSDKHTINVRFDKSTSTFTEIEGQQSAHHKSFNKKKMKEEPKIDESVEVESKPINRLAQVLRKKA